MWIPEELFGGIDPGRSRDLHDGAGVFNDEEAYFWDRRPDLLASSGATVVKPTPGAASWKGYDGGRMENFVFKVTSNNFGVKMTFSPDEATEPDTNFYPYGAYGGDPLPAYDGTDATLASTDEFKPYVRARQTDFSDGGLGWGYTCSDTMFVDVATGGYAPKPEGSNSVTGTTFKIRLSDYRTDHPAGFSYMTTGSVSSRVWLEFASTAPTPGTSYISIALNGAAYDAGSSAYDPANPDTPSLLQLYDFTPSWTPGPSRRSTRATSPGLTSGDVRAR